MRDFVKKNSALIAWTMGAIVTGLSVYVWGDQLNWKLSKLNNYQLFPLLGLVAFSLMWTHYMMAALRVWSGFDKENLKLYTKITGWIVLAAILLHPGLLIFQLQSDGYGLPPQSYTDFVGPALARYVMLGTVAWLAFILYEFKEKLSEKTWWKYVLLANVVAMILIVIHGLQLGQHLQAGWYKSVFMIYALTLLVCFGYLQKNKKLY